MLDSVQNNTSAAAATTQTSTAKNQPITATITSKKRKRETMASTWRPKSSRSVAAQTSTNIVHPPPAQLIRRQGSIRPPSPSLTPSPSSSTTEEESKKENKMMGSPRSAAAAVICNNNDLLTEIIHLLPAKSLVRFQSVDKRWQSLILSPDFSHLHFQRHLHKLQPSFILEFGRNSSDPFCRDDTESLYFNPLSKLLLPYNLNSNYRYTWIMQSSHGLLLVVGSKKERSYEGPFDYYVYNPTTRQSRMLFPDNGDKRKNLGWPTLAFTLAFDPSKSPHYKVVCVWILGLKYKRQRQNKLPQYKLQVDVYDSHSHTWNVLVESFDVTRDLDFRSGIYWENRIYWSSHDIYLDLDKGGFGSIMPRIGKGMNYNYIQWNGSVYCLREFTEETLIVYQLFGNDPPRWKPKCAVDLRATHGVSVLGIMIGDHQNENELSVFLRTPGKMSSYKLSEGSCAIIMDSTAHGILGWRLRESYQFIESLTPV